MRAKITLLGALLFLLGQVGGALSFPSVVSIATSEPVAVVDPDFDEVEVNLKGHVDSIPADGAYHKVDDIKVSEDDAAYSYVLMELEVIFEGVVSGVCDDHDYRLSNGTDVETGINFLFETSGSNVDTGRDLDLMIEPAGTDPGCEVSGGVVRATFQVADLS